MARPHSEWPFSTHSEIARRVVPTATCRKLGCNLEACGERHANNANDVGW